MLKQFAFRGFGLEKTSFFNYKSILWDMYLIIKMPLLMNNG